VGVQIDGFNSQVIVNGNMSSTIDSTGIYIPRQTTISAELTWNGSSPVGKLSLQCCNDGVNYVEVGNAGVTGNTGTAIINFEICGFYWVKIQYIPISGGTGTAQGSITAKAIST
jgi:hypothetical protein